MEWVDTHCHIHEAGPEVGDAFVQDKWAKAGVTDPAELIAGAQAAGVMQLICVGCTLKDSHMAVALAGQQTSCWASIGIHPHEAKDHPDAATQASFAALASQPRVVAVGECGLDYYYTHSSKTDQLTLLEFQLALAQKHDLPLIFHVRDAFEDFWPVFDRFKGLRGVIHSFSSNAHDLEEILSRGLYVGLNGIMTFTKDAQQLTAATQVPLDRLLLETDAPFLTPTPYRGKICKPEYVQVTGAFLAELRGESPAELAAATTANARKLFSLT